MGAVLKFPARQLTPFLKADAAGYTLPPTPPLEPLDPEKTRHLLNVTNSVVSGARALVNFLDANRTVARAAGIEALTVELSGIIDGRRLEPIKDELTESARMGRPSEISSEGFYYLTRAEKLLAEAHEDLARFTGRHATNEPERATVLGQITSPVVTPANDNTVVLAALAIVALAVIALALK
jgi:hypothetical protein